MSDELNRVLERVRQNTTARGETLRDLASPNPLGARFGGRMFVAGDRVFDTVSGLEGEVIDAGTENVVVPTTQRRNGPDRAGPAR